MQKHTPEHNIGRTLRIRIAIALAVGFIVVLSLWSVGIWIYEKSLNELHQNLDGRITLYTTNIVSELEKHEYLPVLLSKDPILKAPFENADQKAALDRANRHLSAVRQTADVSAVYVMDQTGKTIASSNWADPDSFVGKNFQFRPYFQNALKGERGFYFALGTTSKIPGYYLSYPIGDVDNIHGVVVVKGSVARLENSWAIADENVFVTDRNGVVIIASKPAWKFRTITPISAIEKKQLLNSRQYDQASLSPIEIRDREIIDPQTQRVGLSIPTFEDEDEKFENVYIRSKGVLGTDWTVHYIFREANLQKDVIESLIFAGFVWFILILSTLYAWQRRRMIENKMLYQLQNQRMLEKSAATLEARVERRTKDLQETNTQLEKEIQVRLQAEKNLTRTQEELVQAGKLAALGQMAAGITHEMNQPLTAMRSYAENARIFLDRNRHEEARSNLGLIAQLCDRLGIITNQLKVFSRKTSATFEPVDLAKVLDEAISLLQTGQKGRNLTIENNIKDTEIKVMAESIRLEQVFINLLKNAMDALEETEEAKIELDAERLNNRIRINIRDNGPGIPKEDLNNVFDPFFTTKPSGEGLGLGLSLSSQIIQEFSGSLSARIHEESGMVFSIELQAAGETLDG